jgi:hypothetical protein
MSDNNPDSTVLVQLGEVQGQLKMMTAMIQANHESTHQRINDFRHAIEGRIDGVEAKIKKVEDRVDTIDKNERGTALRAAGGGAMSAAIVTGAIEALKMLVHR